MKTIGNNSGYVGFSMSRRALEARAEGKYPKTDFKKEYKVLERTFKELLRIGIINNREWHHTSKYGNTTVFYSWSDEEYLEIYEQNKKEIDKLTKLFEDYHKFIKDVYEKTGAFYVGQTKEQLLRDGLYMTAIKNPEAYYLTTKEMQAQKREQDEISASGLPIEERKALHQAVTKKYNDIYNERKAKHIATFAETNEWKLMSEELSTLYDKMMQMKADKEEAENRIEIIFDTDDLYH